MQSRITLSQLAHYIFKMNNQEPRQTLFDFLERWLRAEDKIFLFEGKSGWAYPEIFYLASGPEINNVDEKEIPKFYDLSLDRCSILDWLHTCSGWKTFAKMKKIIIQKCDEGIFDCREFYDFSKDDLQNEHWLLLQQISIHIPLAFRYCWHAFEQVPKPIIREIQINAPEMSTRGQKPHYKTTNDDSCKYLEILLETNLVQLRKEGVNDAAQMIHMIWNPEHKIGTLARHISPMFPNDHIK